MIDLCKQPLWRAEDLGKPIPDSPHAVSVAMPRWADVIGYEKSEPRVLEALYCGYPRFVNHPFLTSFIRRCEAQFASAGEFCIVFPSESAAERCVRSLQDRFDYMGRIDPVEDTGVCAVTFSNDIYEDAKSYWQYTGEIVSSRLALAITQGLGKSDVPETPKDILKNRIAELSGESTSDVFLFPSGMAAAYAAFRLIHSITPDSKSIQLGLPYADSMRVQNILGTGTHFFPRVDTEGLREIEKFLEKEKVSYVFCEFPGNPQLQSFDLPGLSKILRKKDIPLIVDETIGTYANVDVAAHADIVITSLTKYFSGTGDVIAGSMILCSRSPFHNELQKAALESEEDLLWIEDAVVLERNSRDFLPRMKKINKTAENVADFLFSHPKIEKVCYPKLINRENYSRLIKTEGGFGGLLSIIPKNAQGTSPVFYDNLRVSKGPSLGTNFTLACPYVLLAHFQELDWIEQLGVSPYLVRVSIGLEEPEDLIRRFEEALNAIPA